jgi:hypothetical protein
LAAFEGAGLGFHRQGSSNATQEGMKRLAVPLWLKASRSPLRADDENSKQIPPFTAAASRATGPHTVAVFCEARDFHRDAVILLDGWPDNMPIPGKALHLRHSKYGSRKLKVMTNVMELFAKTHGYKRS